MKCAFHGDLVEGGTLVLAVSDEERCAGIVSRMEGATPTAVVVLDYGVAKDNSALTYVASVVAKASVRPHIVDCSARDVLVRLRQEFRAIESAAASSSARLVLDFSVIPRGDLWMLLRWLTDTGLWDTARFVYTEPEDYSSVKGLPLSSGLSQIQTLPGEAGVTDCSRPVHLVMQLGYEGDQALAVYEETQPARTTLVIPDPPFRPDWAGRTEMFNSHIIDLVGEGACRSVDARDPAATVVAIGDIVVGGCAGESPVFCPLGTKPQLLGLFAAATDLEEQAAVLIPAPLRVASIARARGVGPSWTVDCNVSA